MSPRRIVIISQELGVMAKLYTWVDFNIKTKNTVKKSKVNGELLIQSEASSSPFVGHLTTFSLLV